MQPLATLPGFLSFAIFLSLLTASELKAKLPVLDPHEIKSPPPRIIRTCCSFGYDLGIVGLPGKKFTEITSIEKIGPHTYLGSKEEENGIIYTKRGGFIDLGHVRDQADWTAFLYNLIIHAEEGGEIAKHLGHEGGEKMLYIHLPANLDGSDKLLLAGRIAYDLSVWHEIATWFGSSYIPFIPERYSSFSIEDNYSNLLGVMMGMEALKSDLPYEEAMTQLISNYLDSLGAVRMEKETYSAMQEVENVWWSREKKLPSEKVLLQRNLASYQSLRPWLVPTRSNAQPLIITVPEYTANGLNLSGMYKLSIDLNYKFPVRKMFPYRSDRKITQEDFDTMIQEVAYEWLNETYKKDIYAKSVLRELRKKRIHDETIMDNEV